MEGLTNGDTPIPSFPLPFSFLSVERDLTGPRGDECKFGGGKVIREGMGQATVRASVRLWVVVPL